jgi:hypothetical protein
MSLYDPMTGFEPATPTSRMGVLYCGAYALWARATEAIQKYGVIVGDQAGVLRFTNDRRPKA